MRIFSTRVISIFASLSLIACQERKSDQITSGNNEVTENQRVIRIKGSDTEFALVKNLAEVYMSEHPEIKIIVEGGGSNKGIEALLKNEIDICNSSRKISINEMDTIAKLEKVPVPIMFSVDALAIITNYKVGVDSLSAQQIKMIYSGKINNWKELGGNDLPVMLFGRDNSSGTRDYFSEKFLSDGIVGKINECPSNIEIVNSVTKNQGAVGYVGAGFLLDSTGKPNGNIWAMPVYIENHQAYSPYQYANVKKGDYILTRPLYQYVNGRPNEVIQNFILFELTKTGQDIIVRHGFFPINDYQKEINKLKGLLDD